MNKFMLNITASSGEFYQGDCEDLVLPTGDGVYGVQAGHNPVLVAIHMGILHFEVNGEARDILVGDGIAEVTPAYVMVLVDSAERPEDIDKNRAEAARIRDEIQKNVAEAGIEVVEARITYLAYAPEIAAVMLQRQQASAIIDARKMIVDGAVGMVEMALDRLNENKVVELDDERKAAMVSNLLVVLCGNRDAQPIVNSGSLY